jgi:hypothetical protein
LTRGRLGDHALTANDAIVSVSLDPRPIIENVLQTLPSTTTVAVVICSNREVLG